MLSFYLRNKIKNNKHYKNLIMLNKANHLLMNNLSYIDINKLLKMKLLRIRRMAKMEDLILYQKLLIKIILDNFKTLLKNQLYYIWSFGHN